MKSLTEQMYVYASYHRDARNKGFHFLGVPLITMSLLIPMAGLQFWPVPGVDWFGVSLATAFVAVVLVYYFMLDVALAVGMIVVIAPLLAAGEWAAAQGFAMGGIIFGVAFVGGWIIQLVGHHFEGRKPALVDNLFQVFISPLFLLAEVYFALGIKKGVEAEVERMIAERGLFGVEQAAATTAPTA